MYTTLSKLVKILSVAIRPVTAYVAETMCLTEKDKES